MSKHKHIPSSPDATEDAAGKHAQAPAEKGDYAVEHAARISAEAAVFIRDRVLSIVSHDLRGPLNAIHSWAHVLERKLASEDAGIARAIAGIRTGVEQQVKLIEEVIDKTRAATRSLSLTLLPTLASEVVIAERDNIVATLAQQSSIVVKSDIDLGELPTLLDPVRFGQAVWALLAYAVESASPNSTVDFSARLNGGRIEVSVTFVSSGEADHSRDQSAGLTGQPGIVPAVNTRAAPVLGVIGDTPRHLDNGALPLALPSRVASAHDGELNSSVEEDGRHRVVYRHPSRPVH